MGLFFKPVLLRNCHAIVQKSLSFGKLLQPQNFKSCAMFSTSSVNRLKEVKVSTTDEQITVEGQYKETPKDQIVLKADDKFCPVCPNRLKMDLKYTDVLILSQFLRPDGCMLPRYVTGVCTKGQRKLAHLVHKAQRAGLMPELRPDLNNRERTSLKSRLKWRKYNIYYHYEK